MHGVLFLKSCVESGSKTDSKTKKANFFLNMASVLIKMLRLVRFNNKLQKNIATYFQNRVGFFKMLLEIRSSENKRKKNIQLSNMTSVFFEVLLKIRFKKQQSKKTNSFGKWNPLFLKLYKSLQTWMTNNKIINSITQQIYQKEKKRKIKTTPQEDTVINQKKIPTKQKLNCKLEEKSLPHET